jgi:ketosteroid isomerase-like protein
MTRADYYGNPAGLTREAETVRAIYAAFARRDADAAIKHLAADCELHLRGTAHLTGRSEPYLGHAGAREYFEDVAAAWQELVLDPGDYRTLPGVVIVLGNVLARRDGITSRRLVMWTWRLRDDKATSVRVADLGESTTAAPPLKYAP